MATKIQKWGNSLGVRLPKDVVQKLHLKEGSEVLVREGDRQIVIEQAQIKEKIIRKNMWKEFVVPTKKKRENVSEHIDQILYGASSR
jgi:antitoxin component of MazEF toxin-antitoxin module